LHWLLGSIGICLGYHRLLSHRSLQVPKPLERVITTIGALAMQGGPIFWVGGHRQHHAFTEDNEKDPYSANRGFGWSHILWILCSRPEHFDYGQYRRFAPDTDMHHLNPTLHPDHSQTHPPSTWDYPTISFHSAPAASSFSTGDDSHTLSHSPHHHASHPHGSVIGNPSQESHHWHLQQIPNGCAIANEQAAIAHLTGHTYTQAQLASYEQAHGGYDPHHGTTGGHFGQAIEHFAHVPVDRHFGGTVNEIAQKLHHHEEVFVGVNAQALNLPDAHSALGHAAPNLFDPQRYAHQPADHIVQVTGVECDRQTGQPNYVVVNDPGTPNGRAMEVPIEQFKVAMAASHGYVASTVTHPDTHLSGHQHDPTLDRVSFGCSVSTVSLSDNKYAVSIDDKDNGYSKGNTFYWDSDLRKVAGLYDCNKHRAYTANGRDLGYAKDWNSAAVLVFQQG